jgi:hypothetical protein
MKPAPAAAPWAEAYITPRLTGMVIFMVRAPLVSRDEGVDDDLPLCQSQVN